MSKKLFIFPAEQLLEYSYQELRDSLTGEFYLRFPDGDLLTNDRETILTMPLWAWIKKRPIPLKKSYHISDAITKRSYGKNTHMQLLNRMHWDIYDAYKKNGRFLDQALLEELVAEFYVYGNQHYNLMSIWMEPYVTSFGIGDTIMLFEVPEIEAILLNVKPTEQSVLAATRDIKRLLATSNIPAIRNNPVVRSARAGIIKMDQLVQAIAPTGYIEGIDGIIFPNPLMSNYTDGHRGLDENMIESSKASQAIQATKAELEDAVYQSRRQELLNQIMMTVHPGDCGTKNFTTKILRRENGLMESDLHLHQGKYYFLPGEKPSELKRITLESVGLYDQIIHMRTIVHCAHVDSNGVCETCLGQLAETLPRRSNLGQIMTTDLYAFMIQLQLSKKHHLSNSIVQYMKLDAQDAKFLTVGDDGVSYYFNESLLGKKLTLFLGNDDGKSLTNLMHLEDLTRLSIGRLSEFNSMALEVDNGKFTERRGFILGTTKRKVSFSHGMLAYVKEKYWNIDKDGVYSIDMSDWDNKKPFAYVPMKNDSMVDFSVRFKEQIESDVKKEEQRDLYTDIDMFLEQTFDIINSKLAINHAQVEVAVYGIMIRSAAYSDYALPKPWSKAGVGVMSRAMAMRSFGSGMPFEKHTMMFSSPESFTVTNRPDTLLDPVLMAGELTHDVDGTGQIYSRDDLPPHLRNKVF